MNELTFEAIRFRHAADAIGIPKKTLRNWISREQVIVDQKSAGWKNFSPIDLARLTLTAELVEYGMGITAAFVSANGNVARVLGPMVSYKNAPLKVLPACFVGKTLAVWSTGQSKKQVQLLNHNQFIPEDQYGCSMLRIDLHKMILEMLARLEESIDVDPEDEQQEP